MLMIPDGYFTVTVRHTDCNVHETHIENFVGRDNLQDLGKDGSFNIKTVLSQRGYTDVKWTELGQKKGQWWGFLDRLMNL
jgi:hypothetical protein